MTDLLGTGVLLSRHKRLEFTLWISLALSGCLIVLDSLELFGVLKFSTDPEAELSAYDMFYLMFGMVFLIITIVTIIFWCMWKIQAARNILSSDVEGYEYTPGWSVGWYFVPFANLIKPFQAMRQIWNASAGEADYLDCPNSLLNMWWAGWIISSIASNISLRISLQAENPDVLSAGIVFSIVSSIAAFVAIPASVKIISQITQGQSERFQS
jgi:Domain of unknown function (DUF4328)